MSIPNTHMIGAVRRTPAPRGNQAIEAAIAALLADRPLGAAALVLQIVEDAVTVAGGEVPLARLIALLAPFGVGERLTRTTVFRLVRDGAMQTHRQGRNSACALAGARREDGLDERPAPRAGQAYWTLVMGWPGGLDAAGLALMRKQLRRDLFRQLVAGVFARPGPAPAGFADGLQRLLPGHRLWLCEASDLPAPDQRSLHELAAAAWDLAQVGAGYQRLLHRYAGLPALLRADGALLTRRQAFMLRTLMLCEWRRARAHDPHLPPASLPPGWPGARCAALCRRIRALTAAGAGDHLA